MHYHYNGELRCGNTGFYSVRGQGTLTCYAEDGGPEDVFSWRYEGSFDRGHPTGQGTTTYGEQWPGDPDLAGCVYIGAHVDGEVDGHATSYRRGGTKEYEGEWGVGYWQGRGTLFRLDGITPAREVDWRNGGSYSYEDGSRYEGEWHDDDKRKHGWGILYRRDRTIEHEGWWQNNEPADGPPLDHPGAP